MLDAYRDGVWFVDLAPLNDPVLVPSALAQVLGIKESIGKSLLDSCCASTRATRQMLLVFDNCEHVLGACADLVDALVLSGLASVRRRHQSRIIAYRPRRRRIHSECYLCPPRMPMPRPLPARTPCGCSSIARGSIGRGSISREREPARSPRSASASMDCRWRWSSPGARRRAARRGDRAPAPPAFSPVDSREWRRGAAPANVARDDRLEYDLLDDAEQQLFARLSVFAGGWTVAAAGGGRRGGAGRQGRRRLSADRAYRQVARVCRRKRRSLPDAGDGARYAREKLAASGDVAAMRERHRAFFLALVEDAEPKHRSPTRPSGYSGWTSSTTTCARRWRSSQADAGSIGALRLCGVAKVLDCPGTFEEGRDWCAPALAKADGETPTAERAKALNAAGARAPTS